MHFRHFFLRRSDIGEGLGRRSDEKAWERKEEADKNEIDEDHKSGAMENVLGTIMSLVLIMVTRATFQKRRFYYASITQLRSYLRRYIHTRGHDDRTSCTTAVHASVS